MLTALVACFNRLASGNFFQVFLAHCQISMQRFKSVLTYYSIELSSHGRCQKKHGKILRLLKISRQIWRKKRQQKASKHREKAKTSLVCRRRSELSRCNSSNRQNSPIQQNCCSFWANDVVCISFEIYNALSLCDIVYFMTGSTILSRLGLAAPLNQGRTKGDSLIPNQ